MSRYYLYSPAHEVILPEIHKTTGEVVPERKMQGPPRAVYKDRGISRFYRGTFSGMDGRYMGMKIYTCRSLKHILKIRKDLHTYCGEWFDVYDENGKVDLTETN